MPPRVTHHQIRRLAEDIPALWEAPTTTNRDRKEIVRQVIGRIVINAEGASERVRVRIEWAGGIATKGLMIRPVGNLEQLSYYPKLCERVRSLAMQGMSAATIALCLNEEGYHPPKRREGFNRQGVQDLIRRLGLSRQRPRSEGRGGLGKHEWQLRELAQEIRIPKATLYGWLRRGWVKAHRQEEKVPQRWIVWADEAEVERLRRLRARPAGYYVRRLWVGEPPSPTDSRTVGHGQRLHEGR